MTTPTALRELADRFKDVIDTNMMDGTARRTLHKLVDELCTAASEGGEPAFWVLPLLVNNCMALHPVVKLHKVTVSTERTETHTLPLFTHPPEVARDALLRDLIDADQEYDKALRRMPTKFLGRGYANGLDRVERAKDRRQRILARVTAAMANKPIGDK